LDLPCDHDPDWLKEIPKCEWTREGRDEYYKEFLDETDLLSDSDTDQGENGTVSIKREVGVQDREIDPKEQDSDDGGLEEGKIEKLRREALRKVYGESRYC